MTTELFNQSPLSEKGFNLIAIFNLADLDKEILKRFQKLSPNLKGFKQLLLLGHGGKRIWQSLQSAGMDSDNPVDDYSIQSVKTFLNHYYPQLPYQIIYPIYQGIALQKLGELAGWHHASPFMVGINKHWGSWFAYRAVVLLDSDFQLNRFKDLGNPCLTCKSKPCISNCPGKALDSGTFNLSKCSDYRRRQNSFCRYNCLSRYHCPVAVEHRYSDEQIQYHYSVSMKMIENM